MPRKPGDMKRYVPTPENRLLVGQLAGYGLTETQIAACLGVTQETVSHHYSEEMRVGRAKGISEVTKSLYRLAIEGNLGAAIFYLKCQAGWRDVTTIDVPTDGGLSAIIRGLSSQNTNTNVSGGLKNDG